MDENQKQCKDCKYFVSMKSHLGECRLNPPSVVVGPAPGAQVIGDKKDRWPVVNTTDFCGKFEPKQ